MACPHCSPIKGVKLSPSQAELVRIVVQSPGITVEDLVERTGKNYKLLHVHMSHIREKMLGSEWCLGLGGRGRGYTLTRGSRRSSAADLRQFGLPRRSEPADDQAAAGEAAAHLLSLGC